MKLNNSCFLVKMILMRKPKNIRIIAHNPTYGISHFMWSYPPDYYVIFVLPNYLFDSII